MLIYRNWDGKNRPQTFIDTHFENFHVEFMRKWTFKFEWNLRIFSVFNIEIPKLILTFVFKLNLRFIKLDLSLKEKRNTIFTKIERIFVYWKKFKGMQN